MDPLSNDFFSTLNSAGSDPTNGFAGSTGITPFDQTESLDPYGVVLGVNGNNASMSTAGTSGYSADQSNGNGQGL